MTLTLTEVDGVKRIFMSHSQVQTYNNCNFKWYLQYVENWRPKELDSAPHVGIIIHELLEIWYRTNDWEEVKLHFVKVLKELMAKDAEHVVRGQMALRSVERYIHQFAPIADKNMKFLKTEYHFEVPIKTPNGHEVYLEGYIDALVEMYGKLWVMDHKSVVSSFWDPRAITLDSQFTTYAACMSMLGYNVQGIIVNQLNTYQYKDWEGTPVDKLFKRERTLRSAHEQNNTLREIAYIIDDIFDHIERDRPFKKSLTKNCKYCTFSDACLYHLKGLEIEGFIAQKHKKKEPRPNNPSNEFFEIEASV